MSVLPGKRTDTGHGAEITMTLTPVLGDDLLPNTFQTLVTNDLLKQLGFPLTQLLGDDDSRKLFTPGIQKAILSIPAAQPQINALKGLITEVESADGDARVQALAKLFLPSRS